MALWTVTPTQDHDVYTVVYLLKDALRSALSDAWSFESASCSKPEVRGASHAEIAARLGRFRDACSSLQQREALMLTKLLRARTWAAELRRLSPEFQVEIDQFLETTETCGSMQADFLRDAQRMFNGGASLSRFLTRRKPEPSGGDEPGNSDAGSASNYLVGGQKALYELRVACEVFLAQINDEFFGSAPVEPKAIAAPLAAYLDSLEGQAEQNGLEPLQLEEHQALAATH
jgi:hypothetical protein